jgi:4-coumarate--CoA ligase (photoactive yellow protein activation family)
MLDLFNWEMAALKPSFSKKLNTNNLGQILFGESGLGLDSLELLSLSILLSRSIHLHESQLPDNLLSKNSLEDWQNTALESLNIFSERMSFKTSGSSGAKKYCTHSLSSLEEEALVLSKTLPGRQRILRAVPSHHIYGFIFSILLPRYLNQPIEIIDVRGLSPNALIPMLKQGDLVIGYPEFWKYLDEAGFTFPEDVIGVNSSGPCPEQVGLNLIERKLSIFFEVYGSSETAGVGFRQHPNDEYTLLPFWKRGLTDDKVERLEVSDVVQSYQLQDQLSWSSPSTFFVIGRNDDIVQIAGNNVSINYVKKILKQHSLVIDVAVRLMKHDEGGRLKAFFVLKDNTHNANFLSNLEQYINTTLKPHERPKSIKVGKRVPTNYMGKLCDWSIE